jgi:hypothetical protein
VSFPKSALRVVIDPNAEGAKRSAVAESRAYDGQPSARIASGDPRVRDAMANIVREVDRLLREGPQPTTESKLRGWLETPGLRALLYEGGSGR